MTFRAWLTPAILAAALAATAQGPTRADDEPSLAKVVNLEKVNTSADEIDPNLRADGGMLYYASNASGHFDLMFATRKAKGQPFEKPRPLEELNSKADTLSPFSLPGDTGSEFLYFAQYAADVKNYDVCFTRRLRADPFSKTAIAGVNQVCTEADELHPWISPDAREIYFSRKTKEGWRVGRAYGLTTRSFEKVELLDLPVGFHHATLNAAMTTMIVQGPVAKGEEKLGLFILKRSGKSAKWSGAPEPLTELNHPESKKGETSPYLTADALYFASDRPGGKGGMDLYYVLVKDLKKR